MFLYQEHSEPNLIFLFSIFNFSVILPIFFSFHLASNSFLSLLHLSPTLLQFSLKNFSTYYSPILHSPILLPILTHPPFNQSTPKPMEPFPSPPTQKPYRYFKCPPNFGLFAPVAKVSRLSSGCSRAPSVASTTPGMKSIPRSGMGGKTGSQSSLNSLGSAQSARSGRVRLGVTGCQQVLWRGFFGVFFEVFWGLFGFFFCGRKRVVWVFFVEDRELW